MLPPVDSVPLSERTVATPPPMAIVGADVVDRDARARIDEARARRASPCRRSTGEFDRAAHLQADIRRRRRATGPARQAAASGRRTAPSPEKSSDSAREPVSTVPPPFRPRPEPSPTLALKLQLAAGEVAAGGNAHRAEAGRARLRRLRAVPVDRIADRRAGRSAGDLDGAGDRCRPQQGRARRSWRARQARRRASR